MSDRRLGSTFYIFLFALTLSVACVTYRTLSGGAELTYDDEALHWQLARNLVTTGALVSDDGRYAARLPVYPVFLALFAWLGDAGIGLVRLAQALGGAATAALLARFGRLALGGPAGLVAGLLFAIDPYSVFFTHLLLSENLFTLIAVGATYATWLGTQQRATTRFEGAGALALIGPLAVLTRPSSAGWIVLSWLILAAREQSWRGRGRLVAVLAVVLLLLMTPWALRNRLVLGEFAWLGTNGGLSLYDGQHPAARGDSDQAGFLAILETDPEFARLGEAERDARLGELAWRQMAADPGRVVELAWVKLTRTWNPWPNEPSYANSLAGWAGALFTVAIVLAGGAGSWRVLRTRIGLPRGMRRGWLILILWLPVAYFTAVHCIYVGSVRYRVPVMPLLALAAAGLVATRPPRAVLQR